MEAFLTSTGLVAFAEIGDKTQLLAFLLAARFKRPIPVLLGILAATLLNHLAAGAIGTWLLPLMGAHVLRWILAASFIGMAIWMLIPDSLDEDEVKLPAGYGVFTATVIAFFLAEMGDKTQIATIALAAKYQSLGWVVAGTTLGMMLADGPAVYIGEKAARLVPVKLVHTLAAILFAILGLLAAFGVGSDAFGF
ncbi:TMEM165/GDT1 family protein [Burkholderiaceae bacterium DAT-1]|nr:TMEM165/GDT1 family protein [Burkholderiaceae bacterium DAT-1]